MENKMLVIKNRKCPNNKHKCKYYHPELKSESRCIKDSNIGYCIKEIGLIKNVQHKINT